VVYAEQADEVAQIEAEASVAAQIGFPVRLTGSAPLPFDIAAAVSFADQAQFHPGRYLAGLAGTVVAGDGVLIEGVRGLDVAEKRHICHVETTAGRLSAPHVVVATQYPFLNRGGQFARLSTRRSYGVAGVLADDVAAGMTINVGSPTHSTRTARLGNERLLIVVGEGHEVGQVSDTGQRWTRLRAWARERFGVTDFRYHWSAQEVSSADRLPFVGFIAPTSKRILTATGFDGWGMTNGTAAAILMRDLILGRPNRGRPRSTPGVPS
jgi:glycine/D-amino acid oxidase-like deaminating enzyme